MLEVRRDAHYIEQKMAHVVTASVRKSEQLSYIIVVKLHLTLVQLQYPKKIHGLKKSQLYPLKPATLGRLEIRRLAPLEAAITFLSSYRLHIYHPCPLYNFHPHKIDPGKVHA